MTKKPLAITAAVVAVAAAGAGGVAIAANAGGDRIGDLDAELVNGDTLVMTVEGRNADDVRLTYAGRTQTAAPDGDDDADDEDRDYVARFPADAADRTANARITVRAAATEGSDTEAKTLTARVEVDDDEGSFDTVTPTPTPSAAERAATARPVVRELDVDLVRGDTLVMTVEARDAKTVKLRYGGTTKTATIDRDDAGDRDRDFTARFTAAAGDRTDNQRVSVRATATSGSESTTRTLSDRLDVDTDD